MIYDDGAHRAVVFGGFSDRALNVVAMLYPAVGDEWTRPMISGAPPSARYGHAAIYDPVRRRMLVFGGFDGGFRSDVWQLTLTGAPSWSPVSTQGSPPAGRFGSAVVYDAARDRLVVFGGYNGALLSDVWELSLSGTPTWTALAPFGPAPSGRDFAAVVLDPGRDRVLLFGGYDGSYPQDTWQLTLGPGGAWSRVLPSGGLPAGRSGAIAVFDAGEDRLILHAGRNGSGDLDDLWEFRLQGDPAWTLLAPDLPGPGQRSFHAAALESDRGTLLIVSGIRGSTAINDAWEMDLSQPPHWQAKSPSVPAVSASPRRSFAYAYDAAAGRMIIQGGIGRTLDSVCDRVQEVTDYPSDTWILTLGAVLEWQRAAISGPGPATEAPASTWDPVRRRLLVFGGQNQVLRVCDRGFPIFDDVKNNRLYALSLDGTSGSWTRLTPAGETPPPVVGASAVYDPVQDRMLVYGGLGNNAVWELALAGVPTWHRLATSGTPPLGRGFHSAIYDPVRIRMIVFGGINESLLGVTNNETWELQLTGTPAWTPLSIPGSPQQRAGHTAVYDQAVDRMLVFGGVNSTSYSDVWALEFSPTLRWRVLSPAGDGPLGRAGHGSVFDQGLQRMIVFGGSEAGLYSLPPAGLFNDTWTLDFDHPTPVRLSLFRADARSDAVELIWMADDIQPVRAMIERREVSGSWEGIARADFDGLGRLEFVDRQVVPGHRYGYHLVLSGPAGEEAQGEVWVEIPSRSSFALLGVAPNPATRSLQLSFTIPADAPVLVELVDIGGRTLFSQDLGITSPGAYVRTIRESSQFPSGVYFVRLRQAGRTATARVSIVH